jgi:hypothetical protein
MEQLAQMRRREAQRNPDYHGVEKQGGKYIYKLNIPPADFQVPGVGTTGNNSGAGAKVINPYIFYGGGQQLSMEQLSKRPGLTNFRSKTAGIPKAGRYWP